MAGMGYVEFVLDVCGGRDGTVCLCVCVCVCKFCCVFYPCLLVSVLEGYFLAVIIVNLEYVVCMVDQKHTCPLVLPKYSTHKTPDGYIKYNFIGNKIGLHLFFPRLFLVRQLDRARCAINNIYLLSPNLLAGSFVDELYYDFS